jgi:PAS domain S-box-containing protein
MGHAHKPIKNFADIQPGDHLCCIYSTDEEHRAVLTPYLRAGLERNEKVFYIVDARTRDVVINYLKTDGVDVDYYLDKGQFAILTVADSYMKGGVFDPDGMIVLLKAETQKALDDGFSALRVTGEMSWALRGLPGSERLIEYENKLNTFFPGSRCLAICQYDRRRFDATILLDILRTHPFAFIGANLYDNFYFIPPEEALKPDQSLATLDRWIKNIIQRKETEKALGESGQRIIFSLESADIGAWDLDLVTHTAWRSLRHDLIFGYEELLPEWTYEMFLDHVLPEDRSIVDTKFGKALENFLEWDFECRIRRKDGAIRQIWAKGRPEYNDLHQPVNMFGIVQDITDRKRAEEAIRQSEERYRTLAEASPDQIFIDDRDDTIQYVNSTALKLLRLPYDQVIGKPRTDLFPPEIAKSQGATLQKVFETGESIRKEDMIPFGMKEMWVDLSLVPLKDESGNVTSVLGIARDITERKKADDLIIHFNEVLEQQVKSRTEELNASLDEKVILLREVHHRVNNNLQIIISLVNLQMRQTDNPLVKQFMSETQNRVRAMSLVHEKLYRSESLSHIDFADYTRFLATQLFSFYSMDTRRVRLDFAMDPIMTDINTAIPLGLLMNELITNSLRHAFPDGKEGAISISGGYEGDLITLVVRDNGIGIPKEMDWKNTTSLGMQLVTSLVDQVDGIITLDRENGTMFTITVKRASHQEEPDDMHIQASRGQSESPIGGSKK